MVVQLTKQAVVLLYFLSSLILFALCVRPVTQEDENETTKLLLKRKKLSFSVRQNNSSSFRILQLTDLHLGEDAWTDWGPEQDVKTYNVLRKIIPMEMPDLIILGGDQLTGNNVDANATAYYDRLAAFLESFQVPYALIFGNHDDADREVGLANRTTIKYPAKTTRTQLLRSTQRYAHSLSEEGPTNVFGVSNYVLPVYDDNDDKVKLQVMLLDSGGGSLPQQIVESQLLQWYQSQRLLGFDAVAFQHIPTREFHYHDTTCTGFDGDHGIAALEHDPMQEVSTLMTQDPKLHFLAVGHNHGNSYCCPATSKSSLHVCFGRHSGYGGYGKKEWGKGGRVYDILLTPHAAVEWKSWVRLESGDIVDEYNPSI
jgi:hypothetical protein